MWNINIINLKFLFLLYDLLYDFLELVGEDSCFWYVCFVLIFGVWYVDMIGFCRWLGVKKVVLFIWGICWEFGVGKLWWGGW